jgi:Na+/proline symporter
MDVSKIFPLFDQTTGLLIIGLYAVFAFWLTSWFSKGFNKTKESFLVANRKLGFLQGSMSAGAAWIWAPGLFVAAQQGFNNGIAGVFWFSLGNFFALILFSYGASKIRNANENGFTLSQWFRSKYGKAVQFCIFLAASLYALQGMTINLYAGSHSVELLTGLPSALVSVLLVGIALVYSLRGGQKATVATDMVKIAAIWIGMIVVAVTVFGTTGFAPVIAGIGGVTGKGTALWGDSFTWGLLMGFGIPTVLGHLATPWVDNAAYQNAFSMEKPVVSRAFKVAPLYWTILPIVGGMLGMLGAGLHYNVTGPQTGFINLIVMANVVGAWLPLMYLAVVFAGLVSIVDTQMLTAANLVGNDIHDSANGSNPIAWGRWAMVGIAIAGVVLANIPGLDLNMLFMWGKALMLTFAIPIVLSLMFSNLMTREGFLAGAAVGIFIGIPLYAYGQFFGGGPVAMTTAVLLEVFGSGLLCYVVSAATRNKSSSLAYNI